MVVNSTDSPIMVPLLYNVVLLVDHIISQGLAELPIHPLTHWVSDL